MAISAPANGTAHPPEFPAAAVGKHRVGNHTRQGLEAGPDVRNAIRIDRACSAAICEEISFHLPFELVGEDDRLPQLMIALVAQMAGRSALRSNQD